MLSFQAFSESENEAIRPILSKDPLTGRFVTELLLLTCFYPLHSLNAENLQQGPVVYDGAEHQLVGKQQLNRKPTDKLLSHLISLPKVIYAEDESVDDAEDCDHVRDVICSLQLVHNHAEAILLRLHSLKAKLKFV